MCLICFLHSGAQGNAEVYAKQPLLYMFDKFKSFDKHKRTCQVRFCGFESHTVPQWHRAGGHQTAGMVMMKGEKSAVTQLKCNHSAESGKNIFLLNAMRSLPCPVTDTACRTYKPKVFSFRLYVRSLKFPAVNGAYVIACRILTLRRVCIL